MVEDVPYIMKSWLASLRRLNAFMPDDLFYDPHRELLRRIIERSIVTVAEGPDKKILGYGVLEQPRDMDIAGRILRKGVVHWCHIRGQTNSHNPQISLAMGLLKPAGPLPVYTCHNRAQFVQAFGTLLGQAHSILLRPMKLPPGESTKSSSTEP
jgi:hypothetical protein